MPPTSVQPQKPERAAGGLSIPVRHARVPCLPGQGDAAAPTASGLCGGGSAQRHRAALLWRRVHGRMKATICRAVSF